MGPVALPDSLVGTDSHTTMINGLGVVGWGVGGIEAEAVMLGQPIYMLMPEVVGFELTGKLPAGRHRDRPRAHGHANPAQARASSDKFVEFFGPGCRPMSLADRATIGNMAPEYGATMGFFPVDDETLRLPARDRPHQGRSRARRALPRSRACSAPTPTPAPTFTKTRVARSVHRRALLSPGRSGRRTACRWPR